MGTIALQAGYGDLGSLDASVGGAIGDGTFSAAGTLASGSSPRGIKSADLNGDGILDVSTGDGGGTLSMILGKGDGSFGTATSVAAGLSNPEDITAGDFNGDGVLDVAAVNQSGSSITLLNGNTTSGVAPLLEFSLATQSGARQALALFQRKLSQLASQRAQIGAYESRINVATTVLDVSSENYASASSRIMDDDIAQDSSELTRTNILQQAAAAILSQANQQPSLVLTLLKG